MSLGSFELIFVTVSLLLPGYIIEHRWWFTLGWITAVFAWPFLFGWLLAEAETMYLQKRGERGAWLVRVAGRMVAAQGPINDDSAWDTKFTRVEQREGGQWILVELVDGGWVAGIFGEGSDASVDPHERDIYIADVRYTSFEERFPGLGDPGGILIPASRIRFIHFWEWSMVTKQNVQAKPSTKQGEWTTVGSKERREIISRPDETRTYRPTSNPTSPPLWGPEGPAGSVKPKPGRGTQT